jgi:hypothetical protein
MNTRLGKIARLPYQLREQLNQRILDGEPGTLLLAWLNAMPAVQAILKRDFNSRPISDQNLTEWKKGGYPEWLQTHIATVTLQAMAADAKSITEALGESPTETLSTLIAVKLALLIENLPKDADPRETLKMLSEITRNLHLLRRGDQNTQRIKLAQAKVATAGANKEEHIVHQFRDWMNRTNGWQHVLGENNKELTHEQRLARVTQLLFGKPQDPEDIAQFMEEENLAETTSSVSDQATGLSS